MARTTTSPTPEGPNGFLGLRDAAEYSGLGYTTLRRMIAEGRLPAYRLGKRRIQVHVTDLDAMRHRIPTATPAGRTVRLSGGR